MTYVEFFDKDAIENICACLAHKPDRVIFLGADKKKMERHIARYKKIFEERNIDIDFAVPKSVTKNNLQTMVDILTQIVEENDDCVFGLTGGEDLHLVAMGIVYERYKDTKNIQMHRFNLKNNTIVDCDMDGKTILEDTLPSLTVQENIRIYGGDVIYEYEKAGTTYQWEYTEDFVSDINTMWEICRETPRKWNTHIGIFAKAETLKKELDPLLCTKVKMEDLKEQMDVTGVTLSTLKSLARKLYFEGLILEHKIDEEEFFVTYKDEQVKRCLTKAGQVLEMKVSILLMNAKDKKGNLIYNDVVNGVYIDWDGKLHENSDIPDTANEIDVLAMRGTIPIFISCKNGKVPIDELFKLNSVAEQFGGRYAQKILIAPGLYKNELPQYEYFFQRAEDMHIRVIDSIRHDLNELSDEKIIKLFNNLWNL